MTTTCRSHLFTLATALGALWMGCADVAAQYPDAPPYQVLTEYDVDPTWPQRPENVPALGPVSGIAIDEDDQVWIYNRGSDPVQVYATNGEFVKSWGKLAAGIPHHLRIAPDDTIWITDIGLHVVRQFTRDGKQLKTFGTIGQQGEDESHLNAPTDVAVTPEGDVFISDGYGNRRIVHFDNEGKFVKTWGVMGTQRGQFTLPHSIVLGNDGLLYVADRNIGRIQIFEQDGTFVNQWDQVMMPWGLCATSTGDIWACGTTPCWWRRGGEPQPIKDQILVRFSPDGRVRQLWAVPLGQERNTQPGQFCGVHCIAQDRHGNLYVGDVYGSRAQKLKVAVESPVNP